MNKQQVRENAATFIDAGTGRISLSLMMGSALGYVAGETMQVINNELINYPSNIPSVVTAGLGAVAVAIGLHRARI